MTNGGRNVQALDSRLNACILERACLSSIYGVILHLNARLVEWVVGNRHEHFLFCTRHSKCYRW